MRISAAPTLARAAAPDPWLAWVLPLVLVVAGVLLVGSHYEAPDDLSIIFVLSDQPTIRQIPFWHQMYVFLTGSAGVLSALYQHAPGVPWYGLFLYAGLYFAGGLVFSMLLRTVLRNAPRRLSALLLTGFFLLFFLEHILFFNFTRVALLTGGAALAWLFYDSAYFRARPARLLLPVVGLLLSISIRPHSTLMMGLLLGPPLLLLTYCLDHSRRRLGWRAGALLGLLVVVGGFSDYFANRADNLILKSRGVYAAYNQFFDYGRYFFADHLPPVDQTRVMAVERLILADLDNGIDLDFFRRSGGFVAQRYVREVLTRRLFDFSTINANFLGQWVLLALLGGALYRAWAARPDRIRLVLAAGYFLAFLGAMSFLKLPHRILSSVVSLAAFALVPASAGTGLWQVDFLRRRTVVAVLALASFFNLARTAQRSVKYRALQAENEGVVTAINARFAGQLLAESSSGTHYKYLHPLRTYPLHAVPTIPIDRWTTSLPWFPAHCRALVGADTWLTTLEAIARRPDGRWLLTPAYADFLREYMQRIHGRTFTFTRVGPGPITPYTNQCEYRATLQPPPPAPPAAPLAP